MDLGEFVEEPAVAEDSSGEVTEEVAEENIIDEVVEEEVVEEVATTTEEDSTAPASEGHPLLKKVEGKNNRP